MNKKKVTRKLAVKREVVRTLAQPVLEAIQGAAPRACASSQSDLNTCDCGILG